MSGGEYEDPPRMDDDQDEYQMKRSPEAGNQEDDHSRDSRRRSPSGSPSSDQRKSDQQRKSEPQSLLVRNVSYELTASEIKSAFSKVRGEDSIRDVYIPKDYNTGRPRGFCFVEFPDEEDAKIVQREMDGAELGGREITVLFAQERRKTSDQMRERDRSRRPPPRGRDRSRSPPRRRRYRSRSGSRDRHRDRDARRRRRRSPSRSRSESRGRRRSSSRDGRKERRHRRSYSNDRKERSRDEANAY